MSLRDALNTPPPLKGPRCVFVSIYRELQRAAPDEVQALRDALLDEGIASADIMRALRAEGYQVAAGTVSRHRLKGCRCGTV